MTTSLQDSFASVRSECELCGAWSPFTGRTDAGEDGETYAVLRCPNGDGEFSVWRPEWQELLTPVVIVHLIAERLCAAGVGKTEVITAALAMPLDPPPLGATRYDIREGALSLAAFEIWFDPRTITCDMLEEEFGVAHVLPRSGPGATHVLGFYVRIPDAPARISLFARFSDPPHGSVGARSLSFRIDPA